MKTPRRTIYQRLNPFLPHLAIGKIWRCFFLAKFVLARNPRFFLWAMSHFLTISQKICLSCSKFVFFSEFVSAFKKVKLHRNLCMSLRKKIKFQENCKVHSQKLAWKSFQKFSESLKTSVLEHAQFHGLISH